MFMFWNKRAVLSKRLLKAKVRGEHETECETQEDTLSRYNIPETNRTTQQHQHQPHNHHEHHQNRHQQHQQDRSGAEIRETRVQKSSSSSSSSGSSGSSSWYTTGNRGSVATRFHQGCCGGEISHDEDDEIVRGDVNQRVNSQTNNRVTKCKELLKSLKEHQLEMLLNVVESYGADFGSCVLVPRKQEQQQHRQSPRRLNPMEALKQQEATTCNRRQRCQLASSNVLENTTRRPPHRHILRSRRHNPGTRCTRCVNTHGNNAEDNGQQQRADFATTCFNEEDERAIESRDNETNCRLVEDTTKAYGIPVDDHRQERPAWCSNNEDIPELGHIANDGNAAAARPERDRCRRAHGKNGRSTGTRKRRDSPNNDDYTDGEHAFDNNPESRHDDPHLLSCQIWRWPDLANSAELKKLPVCHSSKDPVYICCNPYHWSRLCKPESPPPPYCLIPDRLRPEDRAPSEISGDYRHCGLATSPQPHSGSLTTNGEGGNEMGQKEWCTLAYWELGGRVGRLYPVEPSTVNVFDSLHDGDGLCLSTLAENHVASPAVLRTRSKIGLGLMLSQESDGVWAYNRSDSPIFVNSPTLDDPESRTLLVYRVPPGFCLNIFDRSKTMKLPSSRCCPGQSSSISTGSFNSGPVDVNSVRISFAKGWGPKYSRQEVTSCPCWLEVLLAPCR